MSPALGSPIVSEKEFANSKLAAKLLRQLQDPLMICSNSLPDWCSVVATKAPHLLPFDLRQLLFRSTALGIARGLLSLQVRIPALCHSLGLTFVHLRSEFKMLWMSDWVAFKDRKSESIETEYWTRPIK